MNGLLERDDVLASLDRLVGRAVGGVGGAVLLEASAGMGKTALLEAMRSRADSAVVLAARGVDLEQDFALGVVRQLFEPVLHRRLPQERDRGPRPAGDAAGEVLAGTAARFVEEGAAFNALYWAVVEMTAAHPTCLVVDDVHWSDLESLRWIGFLIRRLEGLHLAVLLTARPEAAAAGSAFLALQHDPAVQTVRLAPLSPAATGTLVRRSLASADEAFAAACHEASGGNPFLLRELLSTARERGLAPTAANVHQVASLASSGVQRAVLLRLARLGAVALAVARATALLGADSPLSVVADLSGVTLEEAASVAQVLQRVELFAPGPRLSFRHPLLRAAVIASMGEIAVASGHARAAFVLRERGAPVEVIAAHLLSCDPVGEGWAAEILERAARDARSRAAPRLVGRLLERALAEPMTAHKRVAVQAEMGGALATAGEPRGIDMLLRALHDVDDPLQRAAVAVRLAIPMWAGGRVRDLPAVLEDARARLPPRQPEWSFQIAAIRAQAAALGSGEHVCEAVGAALLLVPPPGDDSVETRLALALLAVAATYANRSRDEVAALARRALGDAEAHARAITAGIPLMPAAAALDLVEQNDETLQVFARIEAGQRKRGALAIGLSTTLGWRAMCHIRRGRLADAEADSRLALQTASAAARAPLRNVATAALARVHCERGCPEQSLALIGAQSERGGTGGGENAIVALEQARALRALRRPREAADTGLAVGANASALGYDGGPWLPWQAVAAEALLELGDGDQALQLARRAVAAAERFGAPGPIGAALRVLGLAEHDLERLRLADRTLAGSVMRLERARCLIDLGAALRRDGERAAAREPLREGMELAYRCAASALVVRAHEELRAAGARPRSVVRSGVDALTASELRAARLAAEGLTNREIAQHLFVTHKTIETQLRAAYRKLGVAGRSALPTALAG